MFYEVKLKVVDFTLEDDGSQKPGKPKTETYLIEDVTYDGAGARCVEKFLEKRTGEVISVKETKYHDVYAD
jgi:hypothetical protein